MLLLLLRGPTAQDAMEGLQQPAGSDKQDQ